MTRAYDRDWRRLRARHLKGQPFCVHCEQRGVRTRATDVDHIASFTGRPELRLDAGNLQSLCKQCHAVKTRIEHGARVRGGCDADGVPNDPAHPWRKGKG